MPFYKVQNNELLEAPNFVVNRDYELNAFQKDTYVYPVDGWWWFDTELDARAALGYVDPATPVTQTEEEVQAWRSARMPAVSRRQMRLALYDLGLLDMIDAMIAGSGDRALQINWTEAVEFQRHNPLVVTMGAALGKSEAEIDAVFALARTF